MTAVPPWLKIGSEWALRLLLIGGGIVALALALGYLRLVALPIVLALLITTLLLPPKRWLANKGLPHALATVITMLAAFLLVAGTLTAIAPSIANQVGELRSGVEDGVRQATDVLSQAPFNLSQTDIDDAVDSALDSLRSNSGTITRGLTTGAVVVGEVLTGLVVTALLVFFFLKDGRKMWLWLVWLVGRGRQDDLDTLGGNVFRALGGYFRGIAAIGVFDAVFIGLALWLIGVPLVIPLMVLTFFSAFIPLIGAFLAGLAAVLIALVSNGVGAALLALAAIIIVQQAESHLFYPILMSRSVSLHPAVIVIALAAGGVVAGIIGIFLAVPVATVLSVTIKHVKGRGSPLGDEREPDDPGGDQPDRGEPQETGRLAEQDDRQ